MTEPAPYSAQPAPPPVQPYYAPPAAARPGQAYPAPYDPAAPVPRRPRTWDRVLTLVLLGIGLFGAGFGVLSGILYEESMIDAMRDTPFWSAPPWLGAAGVFLVISHIVLYLAAAAISIPLLVRNRIAFWAPLGAGVLAALIYHGSSFMVGFAGMSV